MSAHAKLNGHAAREQLAIEVQTEALRPTPQFTPISGPSLQERLKSAWSRIRQLEGQVDALRRQKRENRSEFQREIAKQREELGIRE